VAEDFVASAGEFVLVVGEVRLAAGDSRPIRKNSPGPKVILSSRPKILVARYLGCSEIP